MQVRGLPGHVVRGDAVRRWRSAMAAGLTGEAAAKAVGRAARYALPLGSAAEAALLGSACFARVC
jgi:hypothetical protein